MNNNFFWIEKSEVLIRDYESLFKYLSDHKDVCLNYKGKDNSFLFANLLKAIIYDLDFELIDQDFSDEEIIKITGTKYNERIEQVVNVEINDKNIHQYILNSKSNLTLYTSGTTGTPKKVIQPVINFLRTIKTNVKFNYSVWGFSYSPTHMAGLQVFFQGIYHFSTFVNLYRKKAQEIIELIDENEITFLSATPTFYKLIISKDYVNKNIKYVTIGGEKSNQSLMERLNYSFPEAKLNNIYASTEAGSILISSGEVFEIPMVSRNLIKIENDELLIHKSLLGKSNTLMLEDDFYKTGDLIQWVDLAKQKFKFVGRKNEMVNVGGFKVNPVEVEDCLKEIIGIKDAIVFSKENSILGNVLISKVILNQEAILTEKDIREELSKKLQSFKIPRKIEFVNEFLLGRTGKIIKN